MNEQMDMARAEAICEISAAMAKAAGLALERHGNDPTARILLTAAVAMFIENIDREIAPGFKKVVAAMLEPSR